MRKLWYACLAVLIAGMILLAVLGFCYHQSGMGAVGIVFACLLVLVLLTTVARDRLNRTCTRLFQAKKFAEERALLEKVRRGPFSFLTRIVAMSHYVTACMALDDLPSAERIIARLRHGGGASWKYNTAYCFILIKLDGGDIKTARTEYEEFRTRCAHAEIYQKQIEVLSAIFKRLLSVRDQAPLPAAAVNSNYPVVGRILGRAQEARIAESLEQWTDDE